MRKNLLLVGAGDSIFLVNYAKALDKYGGFVVNIYSPFPYSGNYSQTSYSSVFYDNFLATKWSRIPFISFFLLPFIQRYNFHKYLKSKQFDIIHIHRVLPAWVILPSFYKKHCKELDVTFWGGEFENEKLLSNKSLYKKKLTRFLYIADKIINSENIEKYIDSFPHLSNKLYFGMFGSSIIDYIQELDISKKEAKRRMGIMNDKITVLLGYSGKKIHQHCLIIDEIVKNNKFETCKNRIHFIASMTRGSSPSYNKTVEDKLIKTGCSYTLIKDCYQSDKEIALLRLATDIFFQLSLFDGFSASVRENLCAGVVMISGKWLPYDELDKDGYDYIKVANVIEGVESFYEILEDAEHYQKKVQKNRFLCGTKYSWESCIKDFVNAYNQTKI